MRRPKALGQTMKASAPKTILVDTGFWIALLDRRDEHHADAVIRAGQLEVLGIAMPWPSLYETLNTRFAKRSAAMEGFRTFLAKPSTVRIDDRHYRDEALELTFSKAGARSMSLVDWVIRLMLADTNLKIDALWTYNRRDFLDVCQRRGIEMP